MIPFLKPSKITRTLTNTDLFHIPALFVRHEGAESCDILIAAPLALMIDFYSSKLTTPFKDIVKDGMRAAVFKSEELSASWFSVLKADFLY